MGDDANPCSRTALRKTFAGAISKTAEGGEIDALDPGGYGAVTIMKSITIDGGTRTGWASLLAAGTTASMLISLRLASTIRVTQSSFSATSRSTVRICVALPVNRETYKNNRVVGDTRGIGGPNVPANIAVTNIQ